MSHLRLLCGTLVLMFVATTASAKAPRVRVQASSSYEDGETDRGPEMAFDGRIDTSWSEGQAGAGIDEWIEIDLGRMTDVGTVSIWAGDFSDGTKRFGEQNRLKVAEIVFVSEEGAETRNLEFGDRFTRHELRIGKPIRKLKVSVKEVYQGSIFDNSHIAEIALDYPTRLGEGTVKLDKWMEGKEHGELAAAYVLARSDAYAGCKAGEEYSRNFKFLARAAVHGPLHIDEKVQELVPPGYRASFLQFDEEAIEKVQRLKDVNAIPYLETALARATGDDVYWIEDLVKAFRAHEILISSRRHNIPAWGTTGLEVGALNGRSEPVSMDVNSAGGVVVADVGNNRVQWFTTDGRSEKLIGKEPGIAWSWFGEEGDPYATGAAPGDGAGEFEQPVYAAVGNYDVLAVIDSTLRVQTFDEEGNAKGDWVIPSSFGVHPGRGCATPIITWWGDVFYFLLGREVWGYSPAGDQQVKFEVADQIQAGVVLDGKLLVRHESNEVIEYALVDGFQQGKWLKKPVDEDGSEDWDMATDADDNLYIATDAGWLYTYNKRGKFLRKLQMFGNPKDRMRIAVSPTMETLYVSAGDEIHRVDLSE